MKEYCFDIKMFATIRVNAESEDKAREIIIEKLEVVDANLGAWDDDTPISVEVALDDSSVPLLLEIDGEAV